MTAGGSWGQGGTGWRETKPRASRKTGFYFVRGQPRAAENIDPTIILEGSSMEAAGATLLGVPANPQRRPQALRSQNRARPGTLCRQHEQGKQAPPGCGV